MKSLGLDSVSSWSRSLAGILILVFATPLLGQQVTTTFNGRPAVADEILVRLKTNDNAAIGRIRNLIPLSSVTALNSRAGLYHVRANGANLNGLLQRFSAHPDVA